ncbi:MAG: amino acid transporter [Alphaproteobacteria bacterium]|nr:amino acid transporter [Alphaproteobacteria bacterium]
MIVFLKGFAVGASLLVVIGAQNAHVLRMGLLKQHVFLTAVICALCDAVLIVLGISGLGLLIAASPMLLLAVKYGGAAFLFYYGWRSLHSALKAQKMALEQTPVNYTARQAVMTVLAMSLLNPHVYLDTVMLIGTVGAQEVGGDKLAFGSGAAFASLCWFFALAYGSRLLTPVFARPRAWQILDCLVALIVWSIGLSLLLS